MDKFNAVFLNVKAVTKNPVVSDLYSYLLRAVCS